MRTKVAAAVALLLFAAPGTAAAGDVTPIQYAYGGGSNAAAVGATRPPAAANGGSTVPGSDSGGAGSAVGGTGSGGGGTAGSGAGGTGSGTGGTGPGSHPPTEAAAGPLVGLAGAPSATSASSFDTFHGAVPAGALWAIALAVVCALGAWLVRRRSA